MSKYKPAVTIDLQKRKACCLKAYRDGFTAGSKFILRWLERETVKASESAEALMEFAKGSNTGNAT